MEALQCSTLCGKPIIGASASPRAPHACAVEMKGRKIHRFPLQLTADTGSSGLNRNSRRTGRKGSILRQADASVAVESGSEVEEKEQENAPKRDKTIQLLNSNVKRRRSEQGVTGGSNKAAVAADYMRYLPEFLKHDSAPPRWFCPFLDNKSPQNAPVLLFLPEVIGTGLGFAMQQESLGRLFELRCLRIPVMDCTPFEGLVKFVEKSAREEAELHPGRPIYLLGESFGGALALAVASRNPKLDLVLILLNPTTSFDRSPLQPLIPLFQALPSAIVPQAAVMMLLGLISYDLVVLASQFAVHVAPSFEAGQISPAGNINLSDVLHSLLQIVDTLPRSVLLRKLDLLQSSARYVNSRLLAVKAEVLIIASVKDQLLPSVEEAKRLANILPNSKYRRISEGGHMVLLEQGFELASLIKGTGFYRRTMSKDLVSNFVPPTREEIDRAASSFPYRFQRTVNSPVFFSTGDDGQVVPGLSMIPTSKQPLIFVGNHLFCGMDMGMIFGELLCKLDMLPRGLGHPIIFDDSVREDNPSDGDMVRLFGGVPVCGRNMFKVLSRGESIVLYPGGIREALHRKNEWHQIFWPERPEVIRMGARFGATFIPMCAVGDDEIFEILLDYDDLINLPIVGNQISKEFDKLPKLREGQEEEVANQTVHMPVVMPKIMGGPGRLYILFGKPIHTHGKAEYFRDPKNVAAEYKRLKGAVEDGIAYLLKKRKEDPYRDFLPRTAYEIGSGGRQAPTFQP